MHKKISKNKYYTFSCFEDECENLDFYKGSRLSTIFVQEGKIEVQIKNTQELILIKKDQGIIVTPNINIKIIPGKFKIFETCSLVNNKPIIEITDDNGQRTENILNSFKIIVNPKHVKKPWGHEKWISWFKHHHVLKQIYMLKGNKCSLQFHRFKYETNIMIEGTAKVLKDIKIKENLNEKEALEEFNKIDNLNDYLTEADKDFYWSNVPNEIHRVYSIKDYLAYETSTPELDDVIRIEDDNNRLSGLISSEH